MCVGVKIGKGVCWDVDLELLTNVQYNDLLEIMEDYYGQSSTIVVNQFLVDRGLGPLENPTTAGATLDRLMHNARRMVLQAESMRKNSLVAESEEKTG